MLEVLLGWWNRGGCGSGIIGTGIGCEMVVIVVSTIMVVVEDVKFTNISN